MKSLYEEQTRDQPELEIEDNNIILHRGKHFFVRTAYDPDHGPGSRPRYGRNELRPSMSPYGRNSLRPSVPTTLKNQDKSIASSETRKIPRVAPIAPTKKARIPRWFEAIAVVIGLFASLVAHALNMFNFPRYELDEGTYMSSAWAILHDQITPYAYGYGHPPLAWMQIAAWVQMTGGFFTFGNALNSGRVLMLLYALGCSLLVYLIARRLSGSRSAGLLAMVIFSLSPLSITYQRQVLLDNVGTFWLLLSLYLLIAGNSRLGYIVCSSIAFGAAILSKEIFLLFLPVMIYAVWLHTTHFQRKFTIVAFTYTVVALGSCFVLLAVLKGELLPYSWHLPWDNHDHLSMWDTFIGQTKRGQAEGSFATSFNNWLNGDVVLVICSIVAVAFNLIVGWWNRRQLLVALLAISFWLLLIRGGVVLSFYFIPLIPLIAINAAMAVNTIMNWLAKLVRFDFVRAILVLGVLAALVPYDMLNFGSVFTQHPTSAQTAAMGWVREHVPHNDFIVINSYLYMDLREPGGTGVGDGATYPLAHVYYNVASDPEIHKTLLNDNWDRIDYIVADSEMLNDIKHDKATFHLIDDALNSSILRAQFSAKDHDQNIVIQIFEVKHKYPQPVL